MQLLPTIKYFPLKRLAVAFLTGFSLLSAFVNKSHAQNIVAGISDEQFTRASDEIVRKDSIKSAAVNRKAAIGFRKLFKTARQVNWYKVTGGFMVCFYQDGNRKVCGYDGKGNWVYNFTSYGEEKLPRHIWHEVRSVYYAYSIVRVNEVQTNRMTTYVVHMKDDATYKKVRVGDDGMTEIKEK